MEKCSLSNVKNPMLKTIHEEEDSGVIQNQSISVVGKVSVEVDMIESRDDNPKDPNQVDKLGSNGPDDEDNAIVIVDLVDIVCKKQKWSPEKVKWEFRYKR